ncbi:PhzF family phenazine biosynthesis protein [Pseudomonas alliivorans]|nr:PhzF family phenazine biosynthesis protein [Pseudomonas alliivorans]
MHSVSFKQVDVFTFERYKGNPVAVVLDAKELSDAEMQQIANWTNLSETTFVLPKTQEQADYRVRIFTPGSELPFAGHPTIGTAHALIEAGAIVPTDGVVVQECGAGLVRLDVTIDEAGKQLISFELPHPKFEPFDTQRIDELEACLGTSISREYPPVLVDVGARWVVVQLASAQQVIANKPDLQSMKVSNLRDRATGVIVFGKYPVDGTADVEIRAFAPACGVCEDPVCGSGNGAMAAFIRHTGQAEAFGSQFRASQGQILGRAGFINLEVSDEVIKVGGEAVTCIDGLINLR